LETEADGGLGPAASSRPAEKKLLKQESKNPGGKIAFFRCGRRKTLPLPFGIFVQYLFL